MVSIDPSSDVIEERLAKLFPPEYLDARARAHQVIVRRRIVDAAALLWALIFGFAIGEGRTIEDIRRTYVGFAAKYICPSSFHDRLPEELAALLRELIENAMAELPTPHTMTDSVDRFRDIFIADATIIRLNELLEETFPATHPDLAGAKLHVIHNITDATIEYLDITDERTHDSTPFKTGKWLQGRLILLDLAYFKYHRFARIDENDGYFVSRLKRSANPEIVAELRSWRGRARPLVGKQVWDAVDGLTRREIDVLVKVTFKRRAYRGKRSTDSRRFRVVGHRNDNTNEYHLYITNLPADEFTPTQVGMLYRARWEVEVLFRELKSRYKLDEISSTIPAIVEVLVLASILTFVVSRVLLGVVRDEFTTQGTQVIIPDEGWAKTFEAFAPTISDRLSTYLGYDPPNLVALMGKDALKKQSRPLLHEEVMASLYGDSVA